MQLHKKIFLYAKNNAYFYKPQFKLYGWVLLVAYPLFYYLNVHVFDSKGYENLYLRASIAGIGILLLLEDFWPSFIARSASWIWWGILTYTLPFFFTFMLLNNIDDINWILSGFFAIVTLSLFVDGWLYIAIGFTGILFGVASYEFFVADIIASEGLASIATSYLVLLVYYTLFARKNKSIYNAKLTAMRGLAASIAHEMRTPLASISFNIVGLKRYLKQLPERITGGSIAEAQESPSAPNKLAEIPDDIEMVVRHANKTIDMLLANVRGLLSEEIVLVPISMKGAIQQSLAEYPFLGDTRQLVHIDSSIDFKFFGNQDLFSQVIHNLIKNSIYYIQEVNKGSISIRCELGENFNTLYFRDTGAGIHKKDFPYIFDPFFSKTGHGSGLGLFFCQNAMKQFNGDILCNSSYGNFTEFALKFPPI